MWCVDNNRCRCQYGSVSQVIKDMSYWAAKKDMLCVIGVIRLLGGGVSLLLQLVNHKIMNKNKTKTIIATKRWQSKFTNKSRITKR